MIEAPCISGQHDRVSSPADPKDVLDTPLEISPQVLVQDPNVPQASGKYPVHLAVTRKALHFALPQGCSQSAAQGQLFLAVAYLQIGSELSRQRGGIRVQKAV